MGFLIFLILIVKTRTHVDRIMESTDLQKPDGPGSPGWYIRRETLICTSAFLCCVFFVISIWLLHEARLTRRDLPELKEAINLPVSWEDVTKDVPPGFVNFKKRSVYPRAPEIIIEVDVNPQDSRSRFEEFSRGAALNLKSYSMGKIENWSTYLPGAMALDFLLEVPSNNCVSIYLAGTRAVLPVSGGRKLTVTLTALFDEWEKSRWDLIRMASGLAR
jgi:hypothetical protein